MKKKILIIFTPAFAICIVTLILIFIGNNNRSISALGQPIHDPATLKTYINITGHSVTIHAQRNLMTDNGITMNAIGKEAKDANPELNSKSNFEDVPVWIVSFEGLPTQLRTEKVLNEFNLESILLYMSYYELKM